MTKWKDAKIWSGGPVEEWEVLRADGSKPAVSVHPRDMMDYHGLSSMWPRELFSRAVCVGEELVIEVIKLQEELKFHFYYTGLDPMDGTEDPKEYMCLVVYSKANWKDIQRGLSQLGLELDAEEAVDKDTEDLAIQMMLRASDINSGCLDHLLRSLDEARVRRRRRPLAAGEGLSIERGWATGEVRSLKKVQQCGPKPGRREKTRLRAARKRGIRRYDWGAALPQLLFSQALTSVGRRETSMATWSHGIFG
eukprot:s1182_g38.t1